MDSRLESAKSSVRIEDWFAARGWQPFQFQYDAWTSYLAGESGLIHAATGTGKTYAAWIGPLIEWIKEFPDEDSWDIQNPATFRILWITPLRALANDILEGLYQPVRALKLPWDIQVRTGDTPGNLRRKQRERLPTALITTPESLSVLLSYPDSKKRFASIRAVVVDEWHELLSTKRGVQTELALARLKTLCPQLRIWGLSATLGNLDSALSALTGCHGGGKLIQGFVPKRLEIASLIPETTERFPWAGHFGLRLVDAVIDRIASSRTTLLFTNTRSQAEAWYQAILEAKPEWETETAIHHGSIDQEERRWVEDALSRGVVRCVVCTSSLDLGVDFSPVDQVLQVGSCKGVARLLQRAGRSGHSPDQVSRIYCVPTNTLELIENAAARTAAGLGRIEDRKPLAKPLDLLAQHIVTVALGGGFRSSDLFNEVRSTWSYRELEQREWDWVLDFVAGGGSTLKSYEEYKRLKTDPAGLLVPSSQRIVKKHRLSIGTITSDAAIDVRYLSGRRLGSVEEGFISKLRPGDRFVFAGKVLEYVRVRMFTAWVKKAKGKPTIPRWMGGRMPLSTELAQSVREKLRDASEGRFEDPEMIAVRPLLELQSRWSRIPEPDELLTETVKSKEGFHLYLYPFEGRLVHEGLAALIAYRLSRSSPITFSYSVNDYGIELLSSTEFSLDTINAGLFSSEAIVEDIRAALNAAEMAKSQFREIARVSGLIFQGYPGKRNTQRQVQISSGLLFDVFRKYEPDNLLLHQAEKEVLENQLEQSRLVASLERLSSANIVIERPPRFTPFAFPLMVDRLRQQLTSEKLEDRIQRMTVQLEKAAERKTPGIRRP